MTDPLPTVYSCSRTLRLNRLIAILTSAYLRRVAEGRPTASVLARVRPLSAAFLIAINSDRSASESAARGDLSL